MRVFIPTEVKAQESRVALTPQAVGRLVSEGHHVLLQKGAGDLAGFPDSAYQFQADSVFGKGALSFAERPEQGFAEAELVVKVKEPQKNELQLLKKDQILFSYLHLAADRELTEELIARHVAALSFETFVDSSGGYSLLEPMSRVAGRLSIQLASQLLQTHEKGRGILLSKLGAAPAARVLVVGGGIVGQEAASLAQALGAEVTLLEKDPAKVAQLSLKMPMLLHGDSEIVESTPQSLRERLPVADAVILAVLLSGQKAPMLITRRDLTLMKRGAVIVDVAIDQGGCCETSRATTHKDPSYVEEGVVHCCVSNLPGAVPRTSSQALSAAIIESVSQIAKGGRRAFASASAPLHSAVNVMQGKIIHPAIRACFADL